MAKGSGFAGESGRRAKWMHLASAVNQNGPGLTGTVGNSPIESRTANRVVSSVASSRTVKPALAPATIVLPRIGAKRISGASDEPPAQHAVALDP